VSQLPIPPRSVVSAGTFLVGTGLPWVLLGWGTVHARHGWPIYLSSRDQSPHLEDSLKSFLYQKPTLRGDRSQFTTVKKTNQ
jgi:hypothetical protein